MAKNSNVHQYHSQNASGDLRGVPGGGGTYKGVCRVCVCVCVCNDGSAHSSECVVHCANAMPARPCVL